MGANTNPPRGAVKKVVPVNATFSTTNTGADAVYEAALSATVDPNKSVFVPTGHAGGDLLRANGDTSGVCNQGIAVKSDGNALQVYIYDNWAGTYRVVGTVIEYY